MEHLEQNIKDNIADMEQGGAVEAVAEKPEGVSRKVGPDIAAAPKKSMDRPSHISGFAKAEQARLAAAGGFASKTTASDELICSD